MLKYIKKEISKPLTLKINQMLDSGIFPSGKNSKVEKIIIRFGCFICSRYIATPI